MRSPGFATMSHDPTNPFTGGGCLGLILGLIVLAYGGTFLLVWISDQFK